MNFDALFVRLKALGGSLSTTQLVSLGVAFLLAVGIVTGAGWWLNTPNYRVLVADMDPESASQVVTKLRDQKVAYKLTDGGRAVSVPEQQLDQLRIDLATQGLPASGRIGFEIFDKTQFGATEFIEQVNLRRALEGELGRTIASIADIASARVHIALPKESLFAAREQSAKASVVLKLRNPRKPLGPGTVAGIENLVAGGVEGLRPEAVVVMDTFGRPLSRMPGDADAPLGAAETERQRQYERDISAKVVQLLETVVGANRARVNVSARFNTDSEDRIEERWEPNGAVRSHAASQEGGPGSAMSQGVAGARANLPGPAPPGTDQPAPATLAAASSPSATGGALRSTETTNYEVSKVVRHTTRPRGDVTQLAVAVVVDDDVVVKKEKDGTTRRSRMARKPEQLQKLHDLVATAVGFDAERGDQLTVENMSFDEAPEDVPPAPGIVERFGPAFTEVGRVLAVVLLGALAIFFVGRPLVSRGLRGTLVTTTTAHAALPAPGLPRTIAELEGEIEKQLDAEVAAKALDRKMPVLTKRLHGLASKEPESAARLVRTWLLEDRK